MLIIYHFSQKEDISIELSTGHYHRASTHTSLTLLVNVLRFCHYLIVQGKCRHEGDGDIEQERTERVGSVESGRGGHAS